MRHWHYWIGTSQARLRTAFDQDEIEKFRSTNCLAASKFSVAVLISRVSTGASPSSRLSPLFPGGDPYPPPPAHHLFHPFLAPQVDPVSGVPIMFYTGARLRHNPSCKGLPPPPPGCDMQLNHYEAQCCALADPGGCGGMSGLGVDV